MRVRRQLEIQPGRASASGAGGASVVLGAVVVGEIGVVVGGTVAAGASPVVAVLGSWVVSVVTSVTCSGAVGAASVFVGAAGTVVGGVAAATGVVVAVFVGAGGLRLHRVAQNCVVPCSRGTG